MLRGQNLQILTYRTPRKGTGTANRRPHTLGDCGTMISFRSQTVRCKRQLEADRRTMRTDERNLETVGRADCHDSHRGYTLCQNTLACSGHSAIDWAGTGRPV